MKLGICTTPEHMEEAASLGFDYVELAASSLYTMPQETLEQICQAHLPVETCNVLFPGHIQLIRGTSDEEILAYLEETFQRVHQLGGTLVVFGSGKARAIPADVPFEEAFARLTQVLQMICDTAKPYGIKVAVEPLRYAETNIIHTLTEGALLMQAACRENACLLADLYHMHENHESLAQIDVVPQLAHVHISSTGRGVPVPEEAPYYQEFFDHLKASGYTGRVSIEGRIDDFTEEAAAGLAVLKSLNQ